MAHYNGDMGDNEKGIFHTIEMFQKITNYFNPFKWFTCLTFLATPVPQMCNKEFFSFIHSTGST